MAGRHHGSALSLVAGIVGGFGAALGVSLVAIVRVIGGNVAEDMPGVVAIAAAIIALGAVLSAVRGYVRSPAKLQPTASRRPGDRA